MIGEPPGPGPRLKSLGRGLAYLAVAWSAFEILRILESTGADMARVIMCVKHVKSCWPSPLPR
mgnify:CR=1 FL=1